jgi:hypothetical protein
VAVITTEGWERENSVAGHGWAVSLGNQGTATLPTGRFDAHCMQLLAATSNSDGLVHSIQKTLTLDGAPISRANIGIAMGFGIVSDARSSGGAMVVQFFEGATEHVRIAYDLTTHLLVASRAGTTLGTSTNPLVVGQWHHIEVWTEIHDSAGVVQVWLDGVLEINVSGVDTRNGGTSGVCSIVSFRCNGFTNSTPGRHKYDDIVIYDDLGGINDTAPLGDMRIAWLQPSGAGSESDWAANTGSEAAAVDEAAGPDDDTTYIHSTVVGDRESLALADTPSSGTVVAVNTYVYARKADSGARQIKTVLDTGANEAASPDWALTSTYAYKNHIDDEKPAGGAWGSTTVINGAELAVELVS